MMFYGRLFFYHTFQTLEVLCLLFSFLSIRQILVFLLSHFPRLFSQIHHTRDTRLLPPISLYCKVCPPCCGRSCQGQGPVRPSVRFPQECPSRSQGPIPENYFHGSNAPKEHIPELLSQTSLQAHCLPIRLRGDPSPPKSSVLKPRISPDFKH